MRAALGSTVSDGGYLADPGPSASHNGAAPITEGVPEWPGISASGTAPAARGPVAEGLEVSDVEDGEGEGVN
jgi:hypothetical protein